MYHACLFCTADLGANEVVEHFPVGRRLAFDGAKGRLWVVCRKCARWNLTPLEERWEAIDECERIFAATRTRVSTDQVGLARVKEGLELVRIGSPQRPEFAAWRYGDQFGRRYRRNVVLGTAFIATGIGAFVTGPVLGLAIGGVVGAVNSVNLLANLFQQNRVRARIPIAGEKRVAVVRVSRMSTIRIGAEGGQFFIRMPYDGADLTGAGTREVTIVGEPALRAAATILSVRNAAGADTRRIRRAVDIVADAPDAQRLFITAATTRWKRHNLQGLYTNPRTNEGTTPESRVTSISPEMSLALEMMANEDIERRALEGELSVLEEAWRQAEALAGIADNLALPESTEAELKKLQEDAGRRAVD